MSKLAINGGTPVRTDAFPERRPFGEREVALAAEAIRSQNLFGPSGTMVGEFEGGIWERRRRSESQTLHEVRGRNRWVSGNACLWRWRSEAGEDECVVPDRG
jgi:hypothetical protein